MTRRKKKYLKYVFQEQPEFKEPPTSYEVVNENTPLLEDMDAINRICISHKVDKLYILGSAAKGTLTDTSDIDFLVKFKGFDLKYYFENFIRLKESLETLLKREVDLIEEQTLKNPVLIQSIDDSKILIYGGAG